MWCGWGVGKTDENAHPHSDHKNRLALVHNGTIENSATLKAEMEARGIPFKSQTDTEVIVQLIGTYLDEKVTHTHTLTSSHLISLSLFAFW